MKVVDLNKIYNLYYVQVFCTQRSFEGTNKVLLSLRVKCVLFWTNNTPSKNVTEHFIVYAQYQILSRYSKHLSVET